MKIDPDRQQVVQLLQDVILGQIELQRISCQLLGNRPLHLVRSTVHHLGTYLGTCVHCGNVGVTSCWPLRWFSFDQKDGQLVETNMCTSNGGVCQLPVLSGTKQSDLEIHALGMLWISVKLTSPRGKVARTLLPHPMAKEAKKHGRTSLKRSSPLSYVVMSGQAGSSTLLCLEPLSEVWFVIRSGGPVSQDRGSKK